LPNYEAKALHSFPTGNDDSQMKNSWNVGHWMRNQGRRMWETWQDEPSAHLSPETPHIDSQFGFLFLNFEAKESSFFLWFSFGFDWLMSHALQN
jgi:hypothetical protein